MNKNLLLILAGIWIVSKIAEEKTAGAWERREIPGSFERDPDQPCPDTHFEVYIDGKNWCVPKGA